jgi:DNA sulfur modification protein DndB
MTITIDKVIKKEREGRVYFFGSIPSSHARGATFVPVVELSPKTKLVELLEDGYQRPGSMPRMNKFRDFLRTHPHSLVPPVILSGRGGWVFQAGPRDDEIGKLIVQKPAAIIDGQHRLGGYVSLYESDGIEKDIDFLLIDNLDLQAEKAEFVIVNDTQQGVPKSLSLFNKLDNPQLDGIGSKVDSDYIRIAWTLATRDDSPFVGMIARVKIGPEHLFALHSVAQYLEKMFSHGAFADTSTEEKASIAIKYWQIIQDTHPTEFEDISKLGVRGQGRKAFEYKLLELTGFIAWSQIGTQILGGAFRALTQEMDWDAVEENVRHLANKIDWRKNGQYQHATGMVGGPIIRKDMETVLSRL